MAAISRGAEERAGVGAEGRVGVGAVERAGVGAVLAIVLLVGCAEALQQETGIVVDIESPALGQVDAFELLATDGRTIRFDTSELAFRQEFPAAHLNEHRILADPIVVTYRSDGDRRVVTRLDDG